jgi:hypothetical protein
MRRFSKKLLISLIVGALALGAAAGLVVARTARAGSVDHSCMFKGKKLYGKVQIVSAFPDIKVQVVTAFPDLKVHMVNAFPDSCGKWQAVTAFPDIKVQFVEAFPDVKIQYVDAFPGVP